MTKQFEYLDSVDWLAETILEDSEFEDDITDKRVFISAKHSQWTASKEKALLVMKYTKNENAIFDEGADKECRENWASFLTHAATWAMYADVMERIYEKIGQAEYTEEDYELDRLGL